MPPASLAPAPDHEEDAEPDALTPAAPYRWRWAVLAVVLVGDVMDLVDATIVNVAGPTIRDDLGGGAATLQWLGAAYTLTFAIFLITGARLGDIVGRRRMFLIGTSGFLLSSLGCALAPTPEVILVTRALQGGFGALLIPQGFGMLKQVFAENEMSKVFGLFGPVLGISTIGGPILAGLLVDADLFGTGWRMVFLINVPIGLAALIVAVKVLPRHEPTPGIRLDLVGMVLVGLAAVCLVYPLIEGRQLGWPLWTFGLLAAGVVLMVAFVRYERRREHSPLIELSLLRNRTYTGGILTALGFFATLGGVMLVLALFLQLGQGFSPSRTGIALAPMSVGIVVSMLASFALIARLGWALLQIGIAITASGMVILALTVGHASEVDGWTLTPGIFVAGLGMGFVFGQLFDVILAGVGNHEIGSASGVLSAVQQLAAAIGVAVFGTIFFAVLDGGHASTAAVTTVAWACLVPLAASFLLASRLPPKAREQA